MPGWARVGAAAVAVMSAKAARRRRLCGSRYGGRRGEEIGIDEIVSLHGLAGYDGDGSREHRAGGDEGVELAALAAWVDGGRQVGEELRVEGASGEGGS